MDFFIQDAYAQGAQQGDSTSFIIMMVLMFAAFYFLLIRPQQKKQKQHNELVAGLQVGDEVLTAGGVLGKITGVSEHYAVIAISDNTEIKIQKASISMVVPKGTYDEA
ncbi:MAG: preprotein translocase subunit YajC [Gammaproteobacteria bacterium]|jgi:preprotein translocase subunit YajC|nr:preprotein translocase subunit YajC [Gammaproteobacteria bacterium]MDH3812757.1 preprotein translocase subunit YajC [Gammaproteobacteria bacterium]